MTMAVTRPYSLGHAKNPALNWAAGRMHAGSSSICTRPMPEALTRIGQLYHIEQQGKALSIDARQQLRVEQSQPALNALLEWLIQTRIKTANGGGSAKALDYS